MSDKEGEARMSDICMCNSLVCTKREQCYRYMAKENPWGQSYFVEDPATESRDGCDYFWELASEPYEIAYGNE